MNRKKCFEILTGRDEQPRNGPSGVSSLLCAFFIWRHKLSMSGLSGLFVN